MLLQYALGRKTKETLASFYKVVSLLKKTRSKLSQMVLETGIIYKNYKTLQIVLSKAN